MSTMELNTLQYKTCSGIPVLGIPKEIHVVYIFALKGQDVQIFCETLLILVGQIYSNVA